jgi:hypothetical protein
VVVPPTTPVVEEEPHRHHRVDGYSDGYGV